MIPAVVAAFNEEARVGNVVRVLLASGLFSPVLVVDDGSKDKTSEAARAAGAQVLTLKKNGGKAQAMRAGYKAAGSKDTAFFDADLNGLTVDHCAALVAGYNAGYDQTCGLRDYNGLTNPLQVFTAIITGERIVRAWVLERVPWDCWEGFNIETGINLTCDKFKGKTCVFLLPGLNHTWKESKRGILAGFRSNRKMFRGIRAAKKAYAATGGLSCKG